MWLFLKRLIMKKRDIVKSSEEFNKILNNKQRVSNNRYIIFYYPSEDGKKYFGISAPKKYGNAVFRKTRRGTEIFRKMEREPSQMA